MKLQLRGVFFHKSTGKTTKAEALKVESAEWLRLDKEGKEAAQREARKRSRIPTLVAILRDDFLPYVKRRFDNTPKTKDYYGYGANFLSGYLGFKEIDRTTDQNTRDLEAGITVKGSKVDGKTLAKRPEVTTVNCELRTLRKAMNLAAEWRRTPGGPKIWLAKGAHERTRVLFEQESEAYLKTCKPPWRDAATVILGTGARPDEVRKAR